MWFSVSQLKNLMAASLWRTFSVYASEPETQRLRQAHNTLCSTPPTNNFEFVIKTMNQVQAQAQVDQSAETLNTPEGMLQLIVCQGDVALEGIAKLQVSWLSLLIQFLIDSPRPTFDECRTRQARRVVWWERWRWEDLSSRSGHEGQSHQCNNVKVGAGGKA